MDRFIHIRSTKFPILPGEEAELVNDGMYGKCTDSVFGSKKWSWKRFRRVDTTPWVDRLHEDLTAIFEADKDVQIVSITCEFPF